MNDYLQGYTAKPLRIIAIIQLCLVFTALLWKGSAPFTTEVYHYKSNKFLYESVIESPHFSAVSPFEKKEVLAGYAGIKEGVSRPFFEKLADSLRILTIELPPFERAWLLFSLAVSLMILLKIEGAHLAAILLPAIVIAHGIDNHFHQTAPAGQAESLFPAESYLLAEHLNEPLKQGIAEQHAQLKKGWELYLIKEWAHESPNSQQYSSQLEKGEFAFNLERIRRLQKEPPLEAASNYRNKQPAIFVAAYFLWNAFFAGFVFWNQRRFLSASPGSIFG